MNSEEIYKLASELTAVEIASILNAWVNQEELESIESFHSLVSLGDSRALAMATVIAKKYNDKGISEIYKIAYES